MGMDLELDVYYVVANSRVQITCDRLVQRLPSEERLRAAIWKKIPTRWTTSSSKIA